MTPIERRSLGWEIGVDWVRDLAIPSERKVNEEGQTLSVQIGPEIEPAPSR